MCLHLPSALKRRTFLYNYLPLSSLWVLIQTERPFLNLAMSRAGGTIGILLSWQIISRLSGRQRQPLSRTTFLFYYGIWQGACPTLQNCSQPMYCGAVTSLPIWSTPSLLSEQSPIWESWRELERGAFGEKGPERGDSSERGEDRVKAPQHKIK